MDFITLETKINKKEYREISFWNAFFKAPTLLILFALCVIIGILNLASDPEGIMFYLGIVLVIYPFVLVGVIALQVYRMNRSFDVEKATHARYTMGQEGLKTELLQREGQSFTTWEEIYRAYENKHYFILFVNRSQLIAMKKEDIPEGGEGALRELLKEHLGKRCKIR